jgi:BirA family biotin operon repressor/biotin-[acetyl-CoA-carboxylase] ligase
MDIHRVSGRGYRLVRPLDFLDSTRLGAELARAGASVPAIEVLEDVDSTNQHLLRMPAGGGAARVCLAETQRAGRGRRGRQWVATPYRNLMLSLDWRFESGAPALAGLSLAAGVAVRRALMDYGITGVGLKWPNDLLWQERKLGGLLVDIRGEANGPFLAVLGVGINVDLDAADAQAIDQPYVDLRTVLGRAVDRNRLAALVIAQVQAMFRVFQVEGLAPYRAEWEAGHCYGTRRVRLVQAQGQVVGVVHGIDDSGALLLRDDTGALTRYHAGEISVRPVEA